MVYQFHLMRKTTAVRAHLGCKFRRNEFNDLSKTRFRFLQAIFEIKCKYRCLVPALIASRLVVIVSI